MEAENQPPQLSLGAKRKKRPKPRRRKGKQAPADANKHSQPRDILASKKRTRDEDYAQRAGNKRAKRESEADA